MRNLFAGDAYLGSDIDNANDVFLPKEREREREREKITRIAAVLDIAAVNMWEWRGESRVFESKSTSRGEMRHFHTVLDAA